MPLRVAVVKATDVAVSVVTTGAENTVSCLTRPALPLLPPLCVQPPALSVPPTGRLRPEICQTEPPVRIPSPSHSQLAPPSVLISKTTRDTSGDEPMWLHSARVASGTTSTRVAGSL